MSSLGFNGEEDSNRNILDQEGNQCPYCWMSASFIDDFVSVSWTDTYLQSTYDWFSHVGEDGLGECGDR